MKYLSDVLQVNQHLTKCSPTIRLLLAQKILIVLCAWLSVNAGVLGLYVCTGGPVFANRGKKIAWRCPPPSTLFFFFNQVKGATSQVAGSPAVLNQTVIVLDRTVIVLDRTIITIYGVLSFPSAWRWVRPSLVTSRYKTHQRTGPPNSLLSQWWQICL